MEDYDNKPQDNTYIVEGSIFDYSSAQEPPPFDSLIARFSRLSTQPDEEIDLAEAALMIAAQQYPGLNESFYLDKLDDLAAEVSPLMATETDPLKNIEHLNYFLNVLKGFHGNEENYADRRNSFLNDVLELHTGIPITLSLLYIELGKRLGMHFEGIGLPGHFIIRYRELAPQTSGINDRFNATGDGDEDEPDGPEIASRNSLSREGDILLDPFNGGHVLSEEECLALVRERYGRIGAGVRQAFMRPVSNRQFLTRMLNNVKASCITEEDFEQALQFQEFLVIFNPNVPEEKRDRAELNLRKGRFGRAIVDFQTYLRQAPDARDAGLVRTHLKSAFDQMVARN